MQSCLVIDENSIVLKVASRVLAGLDARAIGAATLAEAEKLIAGGNERIDLVLLSSTLPDTSVDVALRALRAGSLARTPILVSIVEANLGLMTRSKRAGATGFTFRPFDRASLTAWIEPHMAAA